MGLSLVLPVVALVSMMPEAAPRQDPVRTVITLSDQPVTVTKAIQAEPGPTRFRPGFLSFRADSPHPFRPLIGWDPERICDSLDGAGFANLGWQPAEVAGTGFVCMARTDEVDSAWRFITSILDAWDRDGTEPVPYAAGTWGPEAADQLLARDGARWRRP